MDGNGQQTKPVSDNNSRKLCHNVEQLFRVRTSDSLMESSNAVSQLEQEAMLLDSNLPSCHDLKKEILSTYIRLRLRIASKCIRAERKDKHKGYLGSKSQSKKAKKTQQTSAPKVITSRPLPNTLLVASDVLGISIPGPPSAASSLLFFQQSSPAAVASSTLQQQHPPAAAPSFSSSTLLQQQHPPSAAAASASSSSNSHG
ncbi:uncharacterized protein LOC117536599 isoform X2 [Gymnodraco acuticeps]|uniref:Uncharacterized protein LOC117536599 isoform X2 n=1 Tax=Gymnodraco acuticeps TaxID=8218 RepID=A0A6P8TIB0_GYMAC|nr:uncharacterized protein LOC117536599 isoform X2 [Gymnodraco acuticeps]